MENMEKDLDGKLLLHACCGPCSLEPVRVLRENGVEPHIYYANSNIGPKDEYERRLSTIKQWAADENIDFVEGEYEPSAWEAIHEADVLRPIDNEQQRAVRCRLCYRQRFEASASFASENGYEAICTTLSISPYQFTEIIREELERAAEIYSLKCAFVDFSPLYGEATRRSREAGMYRQNYCGCVYSKVEAEREREQRKRERKERKEREKAERQRASEAAQ